jgi:hypothetical protein
MILLAMDTTADFSNRMRGLETRIACCRDRALSEKEAVAALRLTAAELQKRAETIRKSILRDNEHLRTLDIALPPPRPRIIRQARAIPAPAAAIAKTGHAARRSVAWQAAPYVILLVAALC